MKKTLLMSAISLTLLAACGGATKSDTVENTAATAQETVQSTAAQSISTEMASQMLDDILAAQPEANKARYPYRNPKATIEYFGIEPGMTVAEVLPGGGWYSKILIPYLGDEGHLVGIDYSIDMWKEFGGFANAEFLEKKETWAETWTADAAGWQAGGDTNLSAFAFGSAPTDLHGQVDVIFLPRAIHHLHRFDKAHLPGALADMKRILKPDGIVAIVAHRAAENQPDGWANGDNGYMKQSTVIAIMEEAGFELAGSPSEINANPKDKALAVNEDKVWRLPPTLGTSRDNPELKAELEAVGETDRMTLKFKVKK